MFDKYCSRSISLNALEPAFELAGVVTFVSAIIYCCCKIKMIPEKEIASAHRKPSAREGYRNYVLLCMCCFSS